VFPEPPQPARARTHTAANPVQRSFERIKSSWSRIRLDMGEG
jgi:hypothetical protein